MSRNLKLAVQQLDGKKKREKKGHIKWQQAGLGKTPHTVCNTQATGAETMVGQARASLTSWWLACCHSPSSGPVGCGSSSCASQKCASFSSLLPPSSCCKHDDQEFIWCFQRREVLCNLMKEEHGACKYLHGNQWHDNTLIKILIH